MSHQGGPKYEIISKFKTKNDQKTQDCINSNQDFPKGANIQIILTKLHQQPLRLPAEIDPIQDGSVMPVSNLDHWGFECVSNFVLRVSNFVMTIASAELITKKPRPHNFQTGFWFIQITNNK